MKRKARIQTGIDDRLVAIYARKSRITNKGDSIGVQFKQSADYAINQLSLPEDYEFARYEDKGLSGYYSDRPDFQRLLRDIEMGKIKAVACYKLDRISRKTSDLMRLLEYFERHDVTLLVCSNNINTRISTSKIIIQVLAIIAEFERDILTERIQDNLMELAKDGRWLGGKTPTGFSSQRVTTGSGKNKSAISFLVPVQEEKEIVLEIYGTFWETRSLLQTANIINEKYETKHGAKFTTSAIRLILRNPIYCVADEYSYNYFLEHDGNLFGEPSDFDGQHGLTAYNKTDQMKVEDEDSTFFNPKFSQLLTRKPISEWIVSVGRHEGFISSRKWVETQNMLDEIAEKYNRPHRKTNALLSGLMYCPICGKRLRVLPESNRWTNGKPRFKYACPGVRAKECTFKGVEGVTLDEFVIHSLSSLQEEHSDYYRQLLENRVASMIRTDQSEKEYQETKKAIERLNADIAAQVRNLREADDALKRFIQDDIKELTDELAKREAALRRMEDTQSENQYLIHELNGMKKRLLSFEEFAKGAQPEALFTLVHSIVDRIYITTDGTKQKCQVYIKGCATEDYSDVLGAAGYIEEEPLLPVASYVPPMCDLDYYSICNECLLKQAVTAVLLISDNVLNGGLCPGSTGHSSWHPFGNKPVGDFAVAIAVNEVLVYLPHQFSFILHNGHDTLVLPKTVHPVECDAPRDALLISSSFAPFYILRHRLRLGLGKRSHQREHEFPRGFGGVDVLFLEENINAQGPKLTGVNKRIHGVPSEPGYAFCPYAIYKTAPAVLDHFHKLRSAFCLGAGESLFRIDADKDNGIIVLE